MVFLKKINYEDIDKEYEAISKIPEDENNYVNKYYNVSKSEFKNIVIPKLLRISEGLDISEGRVPDTYFFLWDDDKIVGLFKIRHYLNDFLRNGAGHIGYGILKEYRGLGYATKGLKAAIEICKELIKEDEIYLSSNKNNSASLKVQIKCGAYLIGENDEEYFTRIKLNNDKNLHFDILDFKRNDLTNVIKKTIKIKDIITDYFEGKICLLNIDKVSSSLLVDLPVGKVVIADNNYKHLIIAPKNKNWVLTVFFNDNDELIASYFDITKLNNFHNEENPFFIGMKLFVCIPNNHEPEIMKDADLRELLDNGMITNDDYQLAHDVANKIIEGYNNHKIDYYEFIKYYFNMMNN